MTTQTPAPPGDDGTGIREHLVDHAIAAINSELLTSHFGTPLINELWVVSKADLYVIFLQTIAKETIATVFWRVTANRPEVKKLGLLELIFTITGCADAQTKRYAERLVLLLGLIDQIPTGNILNGCNILRDVAHDQQADYVDEALGLVMKFETDPVKREESRLFFKDLRENCDYKLSETARYAHIPNSMLT